MLYKMRRCNSEMPWSIVLSKRFPYGYFKFRFQFFVLFYYYFFYKFLSVFFNYLFIFRINSSGNFTIFLRDFFISLISNTREIDQIFQSNDTWEFYKAKMAAGYSFFKCVGKLQFFLLVILPIPWDKMQNLMM